VQQVAPSPFPAAADSQQQLHHQQQQQLRLEQTQRVDVRAPGQVVVARQQQSFVMSMDPQHQQQPPAPRRAYPSYPPHYAEPAVAGYRVMGRAVPAGGYGALPGRVPPPPPSYAAAGMQSHDQDAGVRVHAGRAASTSELPLPTSAAAAVQLPAKVEAGPDAAPGGGGYAADTVEAPAASATYAKLSHPHQRPPNVTVMPRPAAPAGAMNFHPHAAAAAGVKWMPARHPALYPGAYATDAARQPDHSAAAAAGSAGWSLSMAQTQSLYMSNDVPYHPSPATAAAAGYPPALTVVQRIPGGGDAVFQQQRSGGVAGAAAPGQMYLDAYPAYASNRELAFTDTVFVSK